MELELYEFSKWMPEWYGYPIECSYPHDNLFLHLADNPHPMAINILYTHYNFLDKCFAEYFQVNNETRFLCEKLCEKYNIRNVSCKNYRWIENETLRYETMVYEYCKTRPIREITFPHEHLYWQQMCANPHPCVIEVLKLYREKIDWTILSQNSSDAAVAFLLEEEYIDWFAASKNTNEKIIALFEEKKELLSPIELCRNTADNAIRFLFKEFYKQIDWDILCKNPNDLVINHLITFSKTDKRIRWDNLCLNRNKRVFNILRDNKSKITWYRFITNPVCFRYDYEAIRKRFSPLKKEIEEIFLIPENVMVRIDRERRNGENDFVVISQLN